MANLALVPQSRDQRRSPRKRTLLEGRIIFNNRFSIIECLVRDISEGGAQIAFAHPIDIPNDFELEIPKLDKNCRARVMWSSGKNHGVKFLSGSAPEEPSSAAQIQAVVEEARQKISQIAGIPAAAVKLHLRIDL